MIRSWSSLLFWLGMIIGSSLMLYHVSDHVTALERDLRRINAQIDGEQKRLHVLKAEWAYLANPARIEAQAKRHLNLQPTAPHRIAAANNIADVLPGASGSAQVRVAQTTNRMRAATPATKQDRILASLNAGRINDRMTIQHSTAADRSTDKIGALINTLSLRP